MFYIKAQPYPKMSGINNNTYSKKMIDLTESTDNLEKSYFTFPAKRVQTGGRAPPKAPKKKYNKNLDAFDSMFYSPYKFKRFTPDETLDYNSDSESDHDAYSDFHVAKKRRNNDGKAIPTVYDVDATISYESADEDCGNNSILERVDLLEKELDDLVLTQLEEENDLGNRSFEYIPDDEDTAFMEEVNDDLMVDVSSSNTDEINDDDSDDPDFTDAKGLADWWNDHGEDETADVKKK